MVGKHSFGVQNICRFNFPGCCFKSIKVLPFLVPVTAKRPQKPRRLKTQQRRSATVRLLSQAFHLLYVQEIIKQKPLTVFHRGFYLCCEKKLLFFFSRVVIEIHARGNLFHDRMIVFQSLLLSLHSVMSLIILFSIIASETQLFI